MILKKVKHAFAFCREYGTKCFVSVMPYNLYSHYKEDGRISKILLLQKHKAIQTYLFDSYYKVIKEYKVNDNQKSYDLNQCIWTAWLQGEENAPEIIRITLASIRKYSNNHKVIVLTANNIDDYIDVPYKIKEKYNNGLLGHAHFADVVRMMILAKYGGVWLDATSLLHEPIDENAFISDFFSVGFKSANSKYISNNKWSVNVLGGNNKSKYLKTISTILNDYWSKHNTPIDYFVFDYVIDLIYENDSFFKQIIDSLPRSKYRSTELKKYINNEYGKQILIDLFVENQIYYLSYRNKYEKLTKSKRQTNYGYLYHFYLDDKIKSTFE